MSRGFAWLVPLLVSGSFGCAREPDKASVAAFYALKDPALAPAAVRAAAAAVVRIGTAGSSATGVFISPDGVLLTNNHVLGVDVCPREGCYAKLTFSYDRDTWPYKEPETLFVVPLRVDVGLDMAVVQVYRNGEKYPTTGQYLGIDGEDGATLVAAHAHVHVVGHPEGLLKKWSSGDVALTDGAWFSTTAFSLPGSSGSPILSDAGQIVGLLHRSPRGEDVLTASGVSTYSVATSSAALLAAMVTPWLPATVPSVAAAVTDDDVVARSVVYLNAHMATANVNGAPKDVLASLGEACDKALARTDFTSPEDLDAALAPCTSANLWIDCRTDKAPDAFAVCPKDPSAWATRFHGVFDHWRALNGSLDLTYVSFAQAALASSKAEGKAAAATVLVAALDAAKPSMTFRIATYLAAFEVASWNGVQPLDYVRGYATVPHYELSLDWVVSAALWLRSTQLLASPDTVSLLSRVAHDERIDLEQKLYVEDVQFRAGLLQQQ